MTYSEEKKQLLLGREHLPNVWKVPLMSTCPSRPGCKYYLMPLIVAVSLNLYYSEFNDAHRRSRGYWARMIVCCRSNMLLC